MEHLQIGDKVQILDNNRNYFGEVKSPMSGTILYNDNEIQIPNHIFLGTKKIGHQFFHILQLTQNQSDLSYVEPTNLYPLPMNLLVIPKFFKKFIVHISSANHLGTGFFIAPGIILTTYHFFLGIDLKNVVNITILIGEHQQKTIICTNVILYFDKDKDIALLNVNIENNSNIPFDKLKLLDIDVNKIISSPLRLIYSVPSHSNSICEIKQMDGPVTQLNTQFNLKLNYNFNPEHCSSGGMVVTQVGDTVGIIAMHHMKQIENGSEGIPIKSIFDSFYSPPPSHNNNNISNELIFDNGWFQVLVSKPVNFYINYNKIRPNNALHHIIPKSYMEILWFIGCHSTEINTVLNNLIDLTNIFHIPAKVIWSVWNLFEGPQYRSDDPGNGLEPKKPISFDPIEWDLIHNIYQSIINCENDFRKYSLSHQSLIKVIDNNFQSILRKAPLQCTWFTKSNLDRLKNNLEILLRYHGKYHSYHPYDKADWTFLKKTGPMIK